MQKHFLYDQLEPVVEAQGYELVRVLTTGGEKNLTLQLMIDTLDQTDVTVDDCATVSRAVSAFLDEKDPIKDRYTLEVSSPGLDRPLTKPAHFLRFKGFEIKLETSEKVENRKRFKGKIVDVTAHDVVLSVDEQQLAVPFDLINKAKLVITDELWEKYQAEHETAEL